MRMAVLGWGSLIWDPSPDFDRYLHQWQPGGPKLSIEFARKSSKRSNALTLVIDSKIGTEVETLYAISKRTDPHDVVCDLRTREETTARNIGYVDLNNGYENGRDNKIREVIKTWAKERKLQFVAWTDLEANLPYSDNNFVESAIEHLKSLDVNGIREAIRYVAKAPCQIDTSLRQALRNDQWFNEQKALYGI